MDHEPAKKWIRLNLKRHLSGFPVIAPESMRGSLAAYARLRELGGIMGEDLKFWDNELLFRRTPITFTEYPRLLAFWWKLRMTRWSTVLQIKSVGWSFSGYLRHVVKIWRL